MGRRNLPCSTVKAHTEKSMGARFCSSSRASSRVAESLPPGERHRHAVAVADHLEAVNGLPHLAQQCFFQVHWINYTGWEGASHAAGHADKLHVMDAREH